jgi:hypothetical protein
LLIILHGTCYFNITIISLNKFEQEKYIPFGAGCGSSGRAPALQE